MTPRENAGRGGREFGPWRYITKIRATTDRQRIEVGYSLSSWDDRLEAEIESETVFRGFRQVTAPSLDESLPVVNTADLPLAGKRGDRRQELLADGGDSAASGLLDVDVDEEGNLAVLEIDSVEHGWSVETTVENSPEHTGDEAEWCSASANCFVHDASDLRDLAAVLLSKADELEQSQGATEGSA